MTQFWQEGLRIQMQADVTGAPVTFSWERRQHQVRQIGKRWRVDEEWWQHRIWREYFKLTTDTGLLVILFHDILTGDWYLQRLYD